VTGSGGSPAFMSSGGRAAPATGSGGQMLTPAPPMQPLNGNAGSGSGGSHAAGTGGSAPITDAGMQSDHTAHDAAMTSDASSSGSGDCGTRTGMRGKTTRSVSVGGAMRSYVAYLPDSASPTKPLPFVYVFHGAEQSGDEMFDITEYSKLADSEGIAVAFGDGQDVSSASGAVSLTPWNVSDNGASVCGAGDLVNNPNAVDFMYMDAVKMDLMQDQCLDARHVFATGFSMGGYFTHHVACDRSDVRAAAPHSGGTMADLTACSQHMPIIIFHGVADSLITDGCDDPTGPAQSGFPASATLWAQHNGCKDTYQMMPVNGSSGNGQCYLYDGCPKGSQVELCTFTDMDHAWAGSTNCPSCIGVGTGYASATQLQWMFFKQYAW
jgi:polyhydroxybutyrate depolymerase